MKGFLGETHQGHLSTLPEHGEGQVDHGAGAATLTDPAHPVTIGKFQDKLIIHLCVTFNSDTRSRYKVRDHCRKKNYITNRHGVVSFHVTIATFIQK